MTLAAYAATGFAVAGIHAFLLLFDRNNAFHRRALAHRAAGRRAGGRAAAALRRPERPGRRRVPAGQARGDGGALRDRPRAPLRDRRLARHGRARDPLRRSGSRAGSRSSPSTISTPRCRGSTGFRARDWPNVPIVHTAFQIMVGLGTFMALVALWAGGAGGRGARTCAPHVWLLRALALAAPMGFIAIEAGLDRDRGRAPAVDRLRRAADRRGRDADAGAHRAVPRLHPALLLPRRDRRLAALSPDHPEPTAHRVDAHLRPGGESARA